MEIAYLHKVVIQRLNINLKAELFQYQRNDNRLLKSRVQELVYTRHFLDEHKTPTEINDFSKGSGYKMTPLLNLRNDSFWRIAPNPFIIEFGFRAKMHPNGIERYMVKHR